MEFKRRFDVTCTWFILLILLMAPGLTAKDSGFTIDQVMSAPFPSSLTVSSNGNRIAWTFSIRGVFNIYTAEDPGFKPVKLTAYKEDEGRSLSILGFIENDSSLIFTKNNRYNPDHDTNWDGKSTLYKITLKDRKIHESDKTGWAAVHESSGKIAYIKQGDLHILQNGEKPLKKISVRGNLNYLRWSPDGKYLAMETNRGEFPYRYSYIAIYDLENETMRYIDAAVYADLGPEWSPDGKRILFIRRLTHGHQGLINAKVYPTPDPWEIRVADLASGTVKTVWKAPDYDSFAYVRSAWLDNDNIVFFSEADGWRHIYTVPARGGKVRQLTKGTFEIEQFIVNQELGKVFFNSNAQDIDRRHIWSVALNGKIKQETKGHGIEWSPRVTGDHKYLAYIGSDARTPARVFIKPLNGENTVCLTDRSMLSDFPSSSMLTVPKQVIFKAVDGLEIHGQLFNPPKSFKGKRPAITYFHGGPIRQMLLGFHYSSYYHRGYAMNQYFASQGYVVLSVNYRLGIGYGRAFREVADGGPRGSSEYLDLLAGAKYLRSLEYVDSKRIGLWGGSYGGLMTALGLARNSDLFAAGVDFHGVHDWTQWQAWSSKQPNDNDRTAWKSSPLADIHSWRSPVLLIHGDDDRNVPFSETLWLAEKLEKQGVEYELLIFPDDVHSFLLHRNWITAFKATADFFKRKLNP